MLTVSLRGVVYELTTGHSGNTAIGSLYLETQARTSKIVQIESVFRNYGTGGQVLSLRYCRAAFNIGSSTSPMGLLRSSST